MWVPTKEWFGWTRLNPAPVETRTRPLMGPLFIYAVFARLRGSRKIGSYLKLIWFPPGDEGRAFAGDGKVARGIVSQQSPGTHL
jgi:hypothetical protein